MHDASAIFPSEIFHGAEILQLLIGLGISHVIWIPDSTTGQWEAELADNDSFQLLRVCREGEAWPLAAGLLLGGQTPIVIMQSTGLFESGDALRNVLLDLRLPVFAIVGARNWLTEASTDSAKAFLVPVLQAWNIDFCIVETRDAQQEIVTCYERTRREQRPGIVLLAEGRG